MSDWEKIAEGVYIMRDSETILFCVNETQVVRISHGEWRKFIYHFENSIACPVCDAQETKNFIIIEEGEENKKLVIRLQCPTCEELLQVSDELTLVQDSSL